MLDQLLSAELVLRVIASGAEPKFHSSIINNCPQIVILALCSCAVNLLNRKIPVSDDQLDRLRDHRRHLHNFADRSHSIAKKRKVLTARSAHKATELLSQLVLAALDNGDIY